MMKRVLVVETDDPAPISVIQIVGGKGKGPVHANTILSAELTPGQVNTLLEGLDALMYWQLSQVHHRCDGSVMAPGTDSPDDKEALLKVEALVKTLDPGGTSGHGLMIHHEECDMDEDCRCEELRAKERG